MKHLFVEYSIALRLKHLGFDEPCLAFYYDDGNGIELFPISQNDSYSVFKSEKNNYYDNEEDCSAPTYDQVTGWLRERKYIELLILPQHQSIACPLPLYFICIMGYKEDGGMVELFNSSNEASLLHYGEHREALIKGIEKCLTLLENEKENNS